MPDTTLNYGFRIPLLSGDDYQVPDDIRVPITSIDTKIKLVDDAVVAAKAIVTAANLPVAYTPAWTNGPTGAGLAIGNGTLVGRYTKNQAKQIIASGYLLRGSTTNVGSGWYGFEIPVAPKDYRLVGGSGIVIQGAVSVDLPCSIVAISSAVFALISLGGRISTTYPGSWSPGDEIRWTVIYEAL